MNSAPTSTHTKLRNFMPNDWKDALKHPVTSRLIAAIDAAKAANEEVAIAKELFQNAIELGEITPQDGKVIAGRLTVSQVSRTTTKYSAAVKALQEQEVFEGTAIQTQSTSYRYVLKDDGTD
jgi:hypothetical protein